jgi:DNA-binding CsgD family transcriptional regulator
MSTTEFQRRARKIMRTKPGPVQNKPKEFITPLREVDAKPGFPEDPLEKIPLLTAGKFLAAQQPEPEFIIDALLPKGGNIFCRVDPEVDAQMFAIELCTAAAGGRFFPPYGHTSNVTTAMLFKSGSLQLIQEQVKLSIDRYSDFARKRALGLLHLYHPKLEGKKIEYLTSRFAQAELLGSLPEDCELLVVYDTAGFMATKNERDLAPYKNFSSYLKNLNSRGIATAVFFQSARKAYAGHEDDLVMDAWHNVIDLTPWAGAPREFGGGFTVSQLKVSEFGTVPSRYHYWYTVIDGKLESGFECVDSNDAMTMKQVEMTERQMRVKEMLARGIQHKTIAAQLGVDAATISRDAAKLKEKERATSESSSASSDAFDAD